MDNFIESIYIIESEEQKNNRFKKEEKRIKDFFKSLKPVIFVFDKKEKTWKRL